jgi:hypothetical protein
VPDDEEMGFNSIRPIIIPTEEPMVDLADVIAE